MQLIKPDTRLCDIITGNPSTITVLNRLGVTLGVGDATVASMCSDKGLDQDFFTTILNTYINEDYFPAGLMASYSAAQIVDYLDKTNAYYETVQLPNVERHFMLLTRHGLQPNSNLNLMFSFFQELKQELLARIQDDRTRWFPEVLAMAAANGTKPGAAACYDNEASDSIQDKIDDLISMFVMHLKGEYDANLCSAVIIALASLHKDISQNNRIRNRLLMPLSTALKDNQQ